MSGPVAVLHVVEAMHTGGAEAVVVELARGAGPDLRVGICALNRGGPALEAARAAGAAVWVLDKRARRAQAVAELVRLIRRERFTVVHGHNPTGSLYALAAARLAGAPVRVRTEHSLRYPGRHSIFYPLLERALNAAAQRVICVCEAVRESHRRGGAPERKLTVIENGIAPLESPRSRAAVRAELLEHPDIPVVLAVGSLTPQKAHDVLLEGFARGRVHAGGARLWIAGDGPLRGELEGRARALGILDAVRFLGRREDVAALLEAADVFVLSSRREGLSITLLEAMRAGRACLVTDVGGSAEVVAQGAGLVAPPGQPDALGAALERLLGDQGARARLGRAARRRWEERYTAQRMVAAHESLYRELLSAPAPGAARQGTDDGRVVA